MSTCMWISPQNFIIDVANDQGKNQESFIYKDSYVVFYMTKCNQAH